MIFKSFIAFCIVLGSLFWVASGGLWSSDTVEKERIVEKDGFRIRVARLSQTGGGGGMFSPYPFRVDSSTDGLKWKEARRWYQEEPFRLHEDFEIAVLNSTTGYFFNGARYGVTVDAGATWTFFDLYTRFEIDKLPKWEAKTLRANIREDGRGEIYLSPRENRTPNLMTLYTTESFGQSWLRTSTN